MVLVIEGISTAGMEASVLALYFHGVTNMLQILSNFGFIKHILPFLIKYCTKAQAWAFICLEAACINTLELISRTAEDIFGKLYDITFFTLKVQMLHKVADYLERFSDVEFFDASCFDERRFFINSNREITSSGKASTF